MISYAQQIENSLDLENYPNLKNLETNEEFDKFMEDTGIESKYVLSFNEKHFLREVNEELYNYMSECHWCANTDQQCSMCT